MDEASAGSAIGGLIFLVVYFGIIIFILASLWKVFAKAGQPGFYAIIPIFNGYIMTKIAGKEWYWFLLFFVPMINLIAVIVVSLALAERFGKSAAFGIGLAFLSPIFMPILAFGDAQYSEG